MFWSGPGIRNAWPTTACVFAASLPVHSHHRSRATRYGGTYTAMPLTPTGGCAGNGLAATVRVPVAEDEARVCGKTASMPRERRHGVRDNPKKQGRRKSVGLAIDWRPK